MRRILQDHLYELSLDSSLWNEQSVNLDHPQSVCSRYDPQLTHTLHLQSCSALIVARRGFCMCIIAILDRKALLRALLNVPISSPPPSAVLFQHKMTPCTRCHPWRGRTIRSALDIHAARFFCQTSPPRGCSSNSTWKSQYVESCLIWRRAQQRRMMVMVSDLRNATAQTAV